MHSFTHSLTHSLIQWFTHSLTHLLPPHHFNLSTTEEHLKHRHTYMYQCLALFFIFVIFNTVPMGICSYGKFELLFSGKASRDSHTIQPSLITSLVCGCCFLLWSYHQLWFLLFSFMTDGYRIFNVHTNLGACHTHEEGVRHKQVCTRVEAEAQKNCPSPCPTRGSNPGSLDLNSDPLTTELRPLFYNILLLLL